jgi:hypothetical protein
MAATKICFVSDSDMDVEAFASKIVDLWKTVNGETEDPEIYVVDMLYPLNIFLKYYYQSSKERCVKRLALVKDLPDDHEVVNMTLAMEKVTKLTTPGKNHLVIFTNVMTAPGLQYCYNYGFFDCELTAPNEARDANLLRSFPEVDKKDARHLLFGREATNKPTTASFKLNDPMAPLRLITMVMDHQATMVPVITSGLPPKLPGSIGEARGATGESDL